MKYAIIRLKGKQYKAVEGKEILVNGSEKDYQAMVLLFVNDEKVLIGKPTVEGAKVSLKFIESAKGKKIRVLKYKAKSRYRKKMGFRPIYSRLSVEKISCE